MRRSASSWRSWGSCPGGFAAPPNGCSGATELFQRTGLPLADIANPASRPDVDPGIIQHEPDDRIGAIRLGKLRTDRACPIHQYTIRPHQGVEFARLSLRNARLMFPNRSHGIRILTSFTDSPRMCCL